MIHSLTPKSIVLAVVVCIGLSLSCAVAADSAWPHDEYSLSSEDVLTAADRLGPDGRVYPDWSMAGVDGGIPQVEGPITQVSSPTGGDDAGLIQSVIQAVGTSGGGVVQLAPGTYRIAQPLIIRHDSVVLRGAGRDSTTLSFEYRIDPHTLAWIQPQVDGAEVFRDSYLEVHVFAGDDELQHLEVSVDGSPAWSWTPIDGNHMFSSSRLVSNLLNAGIVSADTTHQLQATATWRNGQTETTTRTITVRNSNHLPARLRRIAPIDGAIQVVGDEWTGRGGIRWELHQSASRGDHTIYVAHPVDNPPQLLTNDILNITGSTSDAFDALVSNSGSPNLTVTQHLIVAGLRPASEYEIVAPVAEGQAVTAIELQRPLRHRYVIGTLADGGMDPRVDGSWFPISNVGIEDLTLLQPSNPVREDRSAALFAHGIVMRTARNCWVQRVTIAASGRNPIVLGGINLEARDVICDQAWWPDKGQGTAYVGFTRTTDCLMDGIVGYDLRHAPNLQYSANGNVFRNSVFLGSDAQYHFNWAYDNLFEHCRIDARRRPTALQPEINNGTYGYGVYLAHGRGTLHGPGGGPRNVLYASDVISSNAAILFGGANERYMALYNRLRVTGKAPGMIIDDYSFNHLIEENVFVLTESEQPLMHFRRNTGNRGIVLRNNTIYQSGIAGVLADGSGVSLDSGNTWQTLQSAPPLPQPAIHSIFAWQRQTAQLRIVAPAAETVLVAGDAVHLQADLRGPDGGSDVDNATLHWYIDGKHIGTGVELSWVPPRSGRVLVQCRVTLADGRQESAPVQVHRVLARPSRLPVANSAIQLHWRSDPETLSSDDQGRVLTWTDLAHGLVAVRDGESTWYPGGLPGIDDDPETGPEWVAHAFADKPGLRFTEANDGLISPNLLFQGLAFLAGQERTAILVFRYDEDQDGQILGVSNNDRIAIDDGGANRLNLRRSTPSDLIWTTPADVLQRGEVQVLMVSAADDGTTIWNNGSFVASTSDQLFHREFGALRLGSGAFYGRDFRGYLAEVVVLNTAIDQEQASAISAALLAYYGNASISTPTPVAAQYLAGPAVGITWTAAVGAEAIEIQRQGEDGLWESIAVVSDPDLGRWTDVGGSASSIYRLRARSSFGDSAWTTAFTSEYRSLRLNRLVGGFWFLLPGISGGGEALIEGSEEIFSPLPLDGDQSATWEAGEDG